jgi:hypothetical protein
VFSCKDYLGPAEKHLYFLISVCCDVKKRIKCKVIYLKSEKALRLETSSG